MIGSIIMLVLIILFTVIGFAVGMVKGFAKTKTWAIEFTLSTLFAMAVGAATGGMLSSGTAAAAAAGIITLLSAIIFLCLFMFLFNLFQKLINKGLEKRKENGEKSGGLGVFNHVAGGFALAFKGFVMACIFVLAISTVVDLVQIDALTNFFLEIYDSAGWLAIKPHLFDFVIVGILFMALRHGYENGIISAFWSLVVLGMVVGAGFAAYHLAFNVEAFEGAAESLGDKLGSAFGGAEFVSNLGVTLAKLIIAVGLFILFAIVVAIIAKFVPRILNFAREGKTFFVIDGVLGAFVSVLLVLAIMLFVGSLLEPLAGMEFMLVFDSYFEKSLISNFIYRNNILLAFGMQPLVPIRKWLS